MTLINIFLIVFVISVSIFSVIVIIYLNKIFENINSINKDIRLLVEKTIPILSNLEVITRSVNKVATEAEEYWEEASCLIRNLYNKILIFNSFKKFHDSQKLIFGLLRNFKPISKGISAFWIDFKRKSKL
jgi:predicted PurR-regulated permease PerM